VAGLTERSLVAVGGVRAIIVAYALGATRGVCEGLDLYYIRKLTESPLDAVIELGGRFGLSPEFVKFLLVGAAAAVVNYVALYLLYDAPLFGFLPGKDAEVDLAFVTHPNARLLIASPISVEVAILFKFVWSEGWIFRRRRAEGALWARMVHFNVSAAASAVLTVSVANVLTPVFGITPYISTAIGVLCGFMLNWLWSAKLVWPERSRAAPAD